MSKTRGNTVDPFEVIGRYGADSVRWFLIASSPTWKPKLFDVDNIAEVQRKFFGTLLNTYAFFVLYANVDGFKHTEPDIPVSERPDIDQWILSLLRARRPADKSGQLRLREPAVSRPRLHGLQPRPDDRGRVELARCGHA